MEVCEDTQNLLLYLSGVKNLTKDLSKAYATKNKKEIERLQQFQATIRHFKNTKAEVRCFYTRDVNNEWVQCENRMVVSQVRRRRNIRIENERRDK